MPPPFPTNPATGATAVEDLLRCAAHAKASDIHIDPHQEGLDVRFRIDGILLHVGLLPLTLHDELIARIKILSGARTDVHAVPQDGRWGMSIGQESFGIRASFMPTYHGENAVLRLLPMHHERPLSFIELGFSYAQAEALEQAASLPSGLVLVTGPTGSGKTTTLHACLALKVRQPVSVMTLEDPVECEVPGVRHVHIRHTHGVTFAAGLRAALRQDPDVIMVGEIRDAETARIAVHTALTGHLVLSTLHTTSALEAIPRLVDMGVDAYLLSATLRLIVAQRLVRSVCGECIGSLCQDCRGTGYAGRLVIAETCPVRPSLQKLITAKAELSELRACAEQEGFITMAEHGAEKVEWGSTTREELARVLSQ